MISKNLKEVFNSRKQMGIDEVSLFTKQRKAEITLEK